MGKIKRNVLLTVIILHIPKTWNEPYCTKHQKLGSEHPNTRMLLSEGQHHKNGCQAGRYKSFKTCQCWDHQLTDRKNQCWSRSGRAKGIKIAETVQYGSKDTYKCTRNHTVSTQIKKAQLYVSSKCAIHPQDKSHNAEILFLPPS
jgi:hypothetical protein